MNLPRTALTSLALACLLGLAGCGGYERPEPAVVPMPGTGAATLADASGEQEFALDSCAATPTDGLVAAGASDKLAVSANIIAGSGTVTLTDLTDPENTVEGDVDTIEVGDEGQFEILGSYPAEAGGLKFTFNGRCTPAP